MLKLVKNINFLLSQLVSVNTCKLICDMDTLSSHNECSDIYYKISRFISQNIYCKVSLQYELF